MGELDELKAVGAGWIGGADARGRRIMRERSHGFLLACCTPGDYATTAA
jgi:hypothetical protein